MGPLIGKWQIGANLCVEYHRHLSGRDLIGDGDRFRGRV